MDDRPSVPSDTAATASELATRCLVPAHPKLRARIRETLKEFRGSTRGVVATMLRAREPMAPGLNDGLIKPGTHFPVGTPLALVRRAAAERAPLRGALKIVAVLVDFEDQQLATDAAHFQELFFSEGVLPDGRVKEYFREVSQGLIEIEGEVVGPHRLPQTLAAYAHGESGVGTSEPNARTMARDAVVAADPDVDFAPYDNDANGYVDAFIVIHAGPGGEVSGDAGHIWSHKWVFAGGEYVTDATRVYGYLTVPEDSKIGVCCHELGHLLFGWPDLYDIDDSSSGLGDWCLMAGGSWNGDGDVPAHPSAWCKVTQGWVDVVNQTTSGRVDLADVKDGHVVYRLWQEGADGTEYFLVENRQRTAYDRELPADGLLVYHIDDSIETNSDEAHYRVGLVQADDLEQLQQGVNRGDPGDVYPGSAGNSSLTTTSSPNTHSYAGADTCVSITEIDPPGPVMRATFSVTCAPPPPVTRPTVRRGSTGEAVTRLQQILAGVGFDPGPIDGIFGPKTDAAARAYQSSRGLVIDAIVGPLTWARLEAEGVP
jgi:immune inhibitor A